MKKETKIDYFSEIHLKVGKILSAEKIKNVDMLLKFQVDLGSSKIRILSGIAEYYNPKDLIGWKVIVIMNLKPIELRGELSEGMFLCAKEKNKVTLIKLEDKIKVGSVIT